jgi:hypothetical protein
MIELVLYFILAGAPMEVGSYSAGGPEVVKFASAAECEAVRVEQLKSSALQELAKSTGATGFELRCEKR